MGHRKTHAPRHASLAYLPRKHHGNLLGRIRFWPRIDAEAPRLLGFIGYKAGMTHIFKIEDRKRSPSFGKEVVSSATILETPPMLVSAVRVYEKSVKGLRVLSEAWMKDPTSGLGRVFTVPESFDPEIMFRKIEENLSRIARVRIIAVTQPTQTSVPKKKPDVAEVEVGGGTIQQQLDYARDLLGKTITAPELFKDGQFVDVIAVSTGKGFQGPVKRYGVTIRQHKGRKTKRGVATLGPWKPHHVMYSVARAGQMGFGQRTEYNKRILKTGTDGKEVTPRGGFIRYGEVRGHYMILEGSVAGTEKRPIKLRYPARPPGNVAEEPPQIVHVSLESTQGK